MNLADLNNPRNIQAIFHGKDQMWIEARENQAWQEMPGSWELWGMETGRLMRVKRWLKKSIIAVI